MDKSVHKSNNFLPIAIIGVSALFSQSQNANQFWKNILSKRDLITEVPPSHWLLEDYYDPDLKKMDKTYCKRGGFLPDIPFDPIEFGIPPNVIPALDPVQLLALVVAKAAFNDATQGKYIDADLSKVSVILGTSALQANQNATARMQGPIWRKVLKESGHTDHEAETISDRIAEHYIPWQENTFPGLLSNVVAGRIANRFNLGGTNCVVDAACAGSLAALSLSIAELQLGSSDMVLTGGFDALNDIISFMCFTKTQALSLSGDCRPFSALADGTLLGEGVGMFVLKRLEDAVKDGDSIYAVIRGIGSSSDGRTKSIYAPVAKGQSVAILRAYERAGYSPATVELIEAHGTGTKAGDVAEFNGLKIAFAQNSDSRLQQCALGSVKSQIGHTKAAAGSAGLIKTVMALHHKILPPTIKIDPLSPELDSGNSPFYFNKKPRPWIRHPNYPRRAGVSAFGFGGSNFHVTLEEYIGNKKPLRFRHFPTELIIITAETPKDLLRQCKKLLDKLSLSDSLLELAYETQNNFNSLHPVRLALVVADISHLMKKLQQVPIYIDVNGESFVFLEQGIYFSNGKKPGKIAFLFPGIDSEYIDMGEDITMAFSSVMNKWEVAAECVEELQQIIFRESRLEKNNNIKQIATAACNLGYYELLKDIGIQPDHMLGQGCGELTALCASEAFDEKALYALLKNENISDGLKNINFNMPQKIVVSSHTKKPYPKIAKQVKECLMNRHENLKPAIDYCCAEGINIFIEVGPHNLLTKFINQHFPNDEIHAIHLNRKDQQDITELWKALGKLICLGIKPNFHALWAEFESNKKIETISKFSYSIQINGSMRTKTHISQDKINFKEEEMSNNNNPYLIQMQQELQKQVIDSHNNFQKMMSDNHLAFLQVINNIAHPSASPIQQPTANPVVSVASAVPMAPAVSVAPVISPVSVTATNVTPMTQAPVIASHFQNPPLSTEKITESQPIADLSQSFANIPEVTSQPISHSKAESNSQVSDMESILLEVVVDKTGYPANMLRMDMAIESDLGIDSIKRVEILSALAERIPNLPELNIEELGQLQTLGDIVTYMKNNITNKMPA